MSPGLEHSLETHTAADVRGLLMMVPVCAGLMGRLPPQGQVAVLPEVPSVPLHPPGVGVGQHSRPGPLSLLGLALQLRELPLTSLTRAVALCVLHIHI